MKKWLGQFAGRLLREEDGQAVAEYAIMSYFIFTVTMLMLLGVSGGVVTALGTYYVETTSLICLPIP
jgi:Flp pilus assembly pilin Flp